MFSVNPRNHPRRSPIRLQRGRAAAEAGAIGQPTCSGVADMVSGAAGHSICALIALVLQVACGSVLADGLAGSEWTPVQLAGHPVEEAAGLYVRFGLEGRVTGYGGCNHFVGACQVTDGQISIGPLGATRMACPEPVMRLERVFLQALEQARGFSRDGPGLVLDDAQGNAVAGFRQADWD